MRFKSSEILLQSTGKQLQSSRTINPLPSGLSTHVGHTTLFQKFDYCLPVETVEHPRNFSLRQQHFANPKSRMTTHSFLKAFIFVALKTYLLSYLLTYSMEKSPS